eukprot:PhM_4_TR12928/c0_g1_i2/m.2548
MFATPAQPARTDSDIGTTTTTRRLPQQGTPLQAYLSLVSEKAQVEARLRVLEHHMQRGDQNSSLESYRHQQHHHDEPYRHNSDGFVDRVRLTGTQAGRPIEMELAAPTTTRTMGPNNSTPAAPNALLRSPVAPSVGQPSSWVSPGFEDAAGEWVSATTSPVHPATLRKEVSDDPHSLYGYHPAIERRTEQSSSMGKEVGGEVVLHTPVRTRQQQPQSTDQMLHQAPLYFGPSEDVSRRSESRLGNRLASAAGGGKENIYNTTPADAGAGSSVVVAPYTHVLPPNSVTSYSPVGLGMLSTTVCPSGTITVPSQLAVRYRERMLCGEPSH